MGDKLTIGKSRDNDLVLTDDTVSRHHCELERTDDGVLVRDLGSTNHTKIERSGVQEATLAPGATLSVGSVEIRLQSGPSHATILPSESHHFGEAVGRSIAMRSVFGVLERVAPTDGTVLLQGETGTGKDVLARGIHQYSTRNGQPFVVVDCGAISYNLIESELFGHERGAFTGAISSRVGAFEAAGRGTIFLDEVGELPLEVQPKLLRVIESAEFRRVGGSRPMQSGARVIAATKRDLEREVQRGKFREDLFFRLAVVPVTVPPLRNRREDIPGLIQHFMELAKKRDPGAAAHTLDDASVNALCAHDWPGNVRELRNVLDRSIYLAATTTTAQIQLLDLPVAPGAGPGHFDPSRSYRETRASFERDFERRYVSWLLERHNGNISASAREARMDRKYLYDLARRHGLREKN